MALRLGIGDTLTICKSAIDLCSRGLHDEPEDARMMVADMCLMRSHLQCLSKQMGDEKAFAASRPDIAPSIKRSLAPIQKDLSEIKQMLHERNSKRKPSLHIVDQVRFHVLYKAKVDAFREKIPAHRTSISEMGTLVDAQTHGERRESIARLGSLAEEQEDGRRKDDEIDEEMRELLRMFSAHVDRSEDRMITNEILESMERELADKGGDQEEVNEQMKPFRTAMKHQMAGEGESEALGFRAVTIRKIQILTPTPVCTPW